MVKAACDVEVVPVTRETWGDFERLFSSRGAPSFCWCTAHRFRGHLEARDEKRDAMKALVDGGTPVGVLAKDGGAVVGWCSVAPRPTYAKLERSRTMPKVGDEPVDSVWTVLCFFVPRDRRGGGVARALLDGAVAYAASSGASVVESYPWDTAGISSTHLGHSSLFAARGFTPDVGRRWIRRVGSR